MKQVKVMFTAQRAAKPDEKFQWVGLIDQNTSLIDFLNDMYDTSPMVREELYNPKTQRLRPYHIIWIDGKIIRPNDFKIFNIKEDMTVKIIPFVSGG